MSTEGKQYADELRAEGKRLADSLGIRDGMKAADVVELLAMMFVCGASHEAAMLSQAVAWQFQKGHHS